MKHKVKSKLTKRPPRTPQPKEEPLKAVQDDAHVDEEKDRQSGHEKMKDKVLKQLKSHFRPEFLNRLDGTVVFHSLNKEQIHQIVDLMLLQVTKSLNEKSINLEVTDPAKEFLGNKGYDPVYGARPLRRVIQDEVEDKLSESLLRGDFKAGDTVKVDYDGEKIVISAVTEAVLMEEKG